MSKHTPGPWRVEQQSYNEHPYGVMAPESAKHDLDLLCEFSPEMTNDANARLIAAAPDLLEALEILVSDHAASLEDWEAAHAAVKKARGERA